MANDTYYIHNVETDEIKTIELTDDEQKELDAERQKAIAAKAAAKLEQEQLRLTKISAYEKLGLTEAEIEALLPAPKPLDFQHNL